MNVYLRLVVRFKAAPPTLKSLPRTQNACHGVPRSSVFSLCFLQEETKGGCIKCQKMLGQSLPDLSQHPDPKLVSSSLPHSLALSQSSHLEPVTSTCHLAPRNILQKIEKKQYLWHCFLPTKVSHVWG